MLKYIPLFKLKVVFLMVFVAVIAASLASKGTYGTLFVDKVFALVIAGSLAASGAGALNHYFDRDIDAVMERTKNRPIPSGAVQPRTALVLGTGMIALGLFVALSINYLTALYVLLGAIVYIAVYTLWLKRRSTLNIVIGGFAGSCAILAGWAAITGGTSVEALLVALIIFLWTPSHFWNFAMVHREAYEKARVPMLPTLMDEKRAAKYIMLNTFLLLGASLLLYAAGFFGRLYLAAALMLGIAFLAANAQLLANPNRQLAWRNYKISGAYLGLLFAAMFVDVIF